MSQPPFFSIVTISYNQSAYLRECIDSVLDQDFKDYEYIIQDAGSTDGSLDILSAYTNLISQIRIESDSGPADGLNKAFSSASGSYYLFLNSDDRLTPGALSYFYDWISSDSGQHHVFSGATNVVDAQGKVLRRAYSDRFSLRRAAYGHCLLMQPSTVFSSSCYHSVKGFNVDNKSNWDGELFIDMALSGFAFATTTAVLSDYRIHSSSITGTASLAQMHHNYSYRMYQKITGQSFNLRSKILQKLIWLERKILNPHDTCERLFNGSVYGRA